MRMEKCLNENFVVEEYCADLHHSEMVDRIAKAASLNALLNELFQEKISTQKKHHWILGPEDLNDTLVSDFEVEEAV